MIQRDSDSLKRRWSFVLGEVVVVVGDERSYIN